MSKPITAITSAVMFFVMTVLSTQMPAAATPLKPGERLEYTFRYQGIFSGFIRMNVAHAEFFIKPTTEMINDQEALLTSMHLTTEPFTAAELLYPIRYQYRSWFEPKQQIPLLVSEYLETDEVNEEYLWFDHANQQGYRYVKQASAETEGTQLPDIVLEKAGIADNEQSLMVQSHQKHFTENEVWDYLSLLQRLRVMDLKSGQVYLLPVYTGKEIKQIRIQVEQEQLQALGWNRPAFKLTLTQMRKGKARKDRTIVIWISNDEQRLPLRFYTKRAFGEVDGILDTGRPMTARR